MAGRIKTVLEMIKFEPPFCIAVCAHRGAARRPRSDMGWPTLWQICGRDCHGLRHVRRR